MLWLVQQPPLSKHAGCDGWVMCGTLTYCTLDESHVSLSPLQTNTCHCDMGAFSQRCRRGRAAAGTLLPLLLSWPVLPLHDDFYGSTDHAGVGMRPWKSPCCHWGRRRPFFCPFCSHHRRLASKRLLIWFGCFIRSRESDDGISASDRWFIPSPAQLQMEFCSWPRSHTPFIKSLSSIDLCQCVWAAPLSHMTHQFSGGPVVFSRSGWKDLRMNGWNCKRRAFRWHFPAPALSALRTKSVTRRCSPCRRFVARPVPEPRPPTKPFPLAARGGGWGLRRWWTKLKRCDSKRKS